MKKTVLLFCILMLSVAGFAQDITGDWYGQLDAGITQLRFVLHITQDSTGYSATADRPDQHAKGIPVDEITFKKDHLRFKIYRVFAKYEGIYHPEEDSITGQFNQAGHKMTLNFSRHKIGPPKRPQKPKPPFPYQIKEVHFKNAKAEVTLAGTLTIPKKGTAFPAVVLIAGSGPNNRNEEVFGHQPFWVIADYLSRHGIAVLRYDKRGIGESTGDYATATTANFASDAAAAFAYLKKQKEINPQKIGLIGHSEGGEIAPIVATRHRDVAFIILLAGPGVDGGQIFLKQEMLIGRAAKVPQKILHQQKAFFSGAFQIIKKENDSVQLRQKLLTYYRDAQEKYPDFFGFSKKLTPTQFLSQMLSPWMRHFIRYNPAPTLEKVRCPVLALNGSHDLQVPPRQNLPAIRKALAKGGNKDFTIKELQGLNHLFQKSKTGLPQEYGKIEETIAPKVLALLKNWIEKTVH